MVGEATIRASARGKRVLTAFAERAATLAVRNTDRDLLILALVALVVAGFSNHEDDARVVMPLLERSAILIDSDPSRAFEEASVVIGFPASNVLVEWLSLPLDHRTLASVRFVEERDEDGFQYRFDPTPIQSRRQ
jgi:hypothetical protein